MYAVIQDRGRQFRVSPGDRLVVDHLDAEVGAEVSFPVLLKTDGKKVSVGTPFCKAKAKAKVLAHGRGAKGVAGTYQRRKDNRRRRGFRHEQTTVEIVSIK